MAEKMQLKGGRHGNYALSAATRRRLLARLLADAEDGDPVAAGVLIALSLRAETRPVSATGRVRRAEAAQA